MKKYYFEITVKGRGTFPFDMLRYSHCWPVGAQDVENLENSDRFNVRRTVSVGMIGNHVEAAHCVERFESFMWNAEITMAERV